MRVEWPAVSWLADVDPFFYAARYLRAWALETHLRAALRERFGTAWFDEPAAGAFLRDLWRAGQGAAGAEGIWPSSDVRRARLPGAQRELTEPRASDAGRAPPYPSLSSTLLSTVLRLA